MWRRRYTKHAPPWWPVDEPWPPLRYTQSYNQWRSLRRNFIRRFFMMMVLFMVFSSIIVSGIVWLLSALGFIQLAQGIDVIPRPVGGFLAGLFVFISFLILRSMRRTAVPFSDLLEVVGRVADGDYTARANETGSPEVQNLAKAFNTMTSRLQSNDEQRRRLLADVTHELRTPITVIQGNIEGMIDGVYTPDQAHLQSVLEETQVLSRIIDDLRTLSLAESGALKLQIEPVEPEDLVQDVAEAFEAQALRSGVTLKADIQPNLPEAHIDHTRISEVLMNLVSNALRYTPQGGSIKLRAWSDGGTPQKLWFSVADTGAGIPVADLPHIFDRFYKSADSRGTGLGLAIARSLVQAHGGEIHAESTPGTGTKITFWIPVI